MNTLASEVLSPTGFDGPRNYIGQTEFPGMLCAYGKNRDSDHLQESNFDAFLSALGGEGENVAIVRIGHWACGWCEYIGVREGTPEAEIAEQLREKLEDYPILNEEDFSNREWADYAEGWADYGAEDFARGLKSEIGLSDFAADYLADHPAELQEYFEACIPSGEYYTPEGSGVSVNIRSALHGAYRDPVAKLIRRIRSAR